MTLPGPSKTIVVEPVELPERDAPPQPEPRPAPREEPEKAPAA